MAKGNSSGAKGLLLALGVAWSLPGFVPALSAATLYEQDGVLNGRQEVMRWLVNRARYAPEREADRLGLVNSTPGGSPHFDACEDVSGSNAFGTTTEQWSHWVTAKGPLAPHAALTRAAQKHAQDMAETGKFQHTSPSANYYPLNSWPWNRTAAEGYANQVAGYLENLAYAGYGSSITYPPQANSPGGVHQNLFIDVTAADRGHRQAILNPAAREIGVGWQRSYGRNGSFYMTYDYDAQDFGRRIGHHFFTDTIFRDANSNGVYDDGEGVGGVEVRLHQNGVEAAHYDVSGPSGSFAVPLQGLTPGAPVDITLVNGSTNSVTLSVPVDYDSLGHLDLPAGTSRVLASFLQPAEDTNVGFRQAEPKTVLAIRTENGTVCLAFTALRGLTYAVDALDVGGSGDWFLMEELVAQQSEPVCLDSSQNQPAAAGAIPARLYRVRLLKD